MFFISHSSFLRQLATFTFLNNKGKNFNKKKYQMVVMDNQETKGSGITYLIVSNIKKIIFTKTKPAGRQTH
jgi:hypothetical protein